MAGQLSKTQMLDNLRVMLRDVFKLRREGIAYAKLARAHGYVDGYMRALLDLEIVDKAELLEIVATERERSSGPAMRVLDEVTPAPQGKTFAA